MSPSRPRHSRVASDRREPNQAAERSPGGSHAEFHRPYPVHDLPANGRLVRIEATAAERAVLADLFNVLEIRQLEAEGELRPEAGGLRVMLRARLRAQVVQSCVVTLEPVFAELNASFERLFATEITDDDESTATEIFLDLSEDVLCDPLSGGLIDLGAVAQEQLALELDPYPRAPGAIFTGIGDDDQEGEREDKDSPLARLKTLRRGRDHRG